MAKKTSIKCPHCGYEYLPAEIYYPETFLGKPEEIIKDNVGAILGFEGSDMNTIETFCCDNCNKTFSVEAIVTFKTTAVNDVFADDNDFAELNKD